jgi:general secretion pathway protein D
MRRPAFILGSVTGLLASLSLFTFGADNPSASPVVSCGNGVPGGVNCIVSKQDKKQGRQAYARGLKLESHKDLEDAFKEFDQAVRLVPQDPQYLRARELVKAQLVFGHVEHGNILMLANDRAKAATEFRAAVDLDPDNAFARERLEESSAAMFPAFPAAPSRLPDRLTNAGEIHVVPKGDHATFHYRGDVRGLFAELALAYGVTATFDDSVKAKDVYFSVDDVDFFTALKLACEITKTMWSALDTHQVLIAADNAENHRQFDRMSLAVFALPPHADAKEATEIVNTMRTLFDLRFINAGTTTDRIEVRAPGPVLNACRQLLAQFDTQRPQVMLDVNVYDISHDLTRNIGVHIPQTFNLYNIPAAALLGLTSGQNIQQLINQLVSSGGINQAGNTSIAGLLSQLLGQNSGIFSQPLATFGGGLTFSGLSLDQFTAALSVNESWSRSLSHVNMRGSQSNKTSFHLGERYPILNASFSPIFNSPQIAQVIGNQSFQAPFPSVSYEDLGLNIEMTPTVQGDSSITLALKLQVRSLTGQSANGVPVISNQEYDGSISVKDGEPATVAGQLSLSDTLSMTGIPGLGLLPGLSQIMVNNTKQSEVDELLIVIVPHVLAQTFRTSSSEIWIGQ